MFNVAGYRLVGRTRRTSHFPLAKEEIAGWNEGFEVPDADELSGSSMPSPQVGLRGRQVGPVFWCPREAQLAVWSFQIAE